MRTLGCWQGRWLALAALLLAAMPVLRLSFQDIREGLSDGGRSAAGRLWQRLRSQSCCGGTRGRGGCLLVGAGLLGQSLYRLLHVENGFDTTHLATVQVMLAMRQQGNRHDKPEKVEPCTGEIERRLKALPGRGIGGQYTGDLPVQCNCDTDWIRIVGKPFHGEHNEARSSAM